MHPVSVQSSTSSIQIRRCLPLAHRSQISPSIPAERRSSSLTALPQYLHFFKITSHLLHPLFHLLMIWFTLKWFSSPVDIQSFSVDLMNERVIVETSLDAESVRNLLETSGRKAIVRGVGTTAAGMQGKLTSPGANKRYFGHGCIHRAVGKCIKLVSKSTAAQEAKKLFTGPHVFRRSRFRIRSQHSPQRRRAACDRRHSDFPALRWQLRCGRDCRWTDSQQTPCRDGSRGRRSVGGLRQLWVHFCGPHREKGEEGLIGFSKQNYLGIEMFFAVEISRISIEIADFLDRMNEGCFVFVFYVCWWSGLIALRC